MVHTPTQTHATYKQKNPPLMLKARGPPVATAGNPEKARSRVQSSLLKTPKAVLTVEARRPKRHPPSGAVPCRAFLGRNMVTVGAVAFPYFYSRFVILT